MKSFTFSQFMHKNRDEGTCLMEAVAYINGEEHTDSPKCADTSITSLAIFINDSMEDKDRTKILEPFLWRIPGTNVKEFQPIRENAKRI